VTIPTTPPETGPIVLIEGTAPVPLEGPPQKCALVLDTAPIPLYGPTTEVVIIE